MGCELALKLNCDLRQANRGKLYLPDIVHAFVPGLFTQTAGKTITGMYDHMMRRKAGAANPENWPDYEI